MIARWSFAVLMIVLALWLYLLTALVMRAIDRAEQLIDREHGTLPDAMPLLAPLRHVAEWVDDRMRPVLAEDDEPEPEPAPEPIRRPSPRPRPQPPETVPLERAWDESAAELTEQQRWQAQQDAEYAAAMARIEEMAKGVGA